MMLQKALAVLAAALVLGGCSDELASGAQAQNTLVFTRQDGSRVEFSDRFSVWCSAWEPGEVETPAVHVATTSVRDERGWKLDAVRADVGSGATIGFPNEFVWNQPKGALLFVLDGNNELSTAESESSGSITFQEVSCERGGTVRFTIDATVGSELHNGPTMRVTGSFTGRVGSSPR